MYSKQVGPVVCLGTYNVHFYLVLRWPCIRDWELGVVGWDKQEQEMCSLGYLPKLCLC